MKRIEYKLVRYEIGLMNRLKGEDFGDRFLALLTEQGLEGWDLKEIIRESGLESLLIFSRPSD